MKSKVNKRKEKKVGVGEAEVQINRDVGLILEASNDGKVQKCSSPGAPHPTGSLCLTLVVGSFLLFFMLVMSHNSD